ESGELKVWDVRGGKKPLAPGIRTAYRLECVAWSPDGTRLATGGGRSGDLRHTMPGELRVWDAVTGREVLSLVGQSGGVHSVAWRPDGKRLASAGGRETGVAAPGSAKVWDAVTGKELWDLKGNSGPVHSISWSPDGLRVATTSFDNDRQAAGGMVKIWDA